MKRAIFLVAALAAGIPALAQTIDISPLDALAAGDAFTLTLTGLPPDASVLVVAERARMERSRMSVYRSSARFRSSGSGTIDLARQAPLEGSYAHADVTGLFWSMAPVGERDSNALAPGVVRLTALLDGQTVASRQIVLDDPLAQVRVDKAVPFPGALLMRPRAAGRRPAVIVLGGSEGGVRSASEIAQRLAAHGYAALALPYFSPDVPGQGQREFKELPASFVDIPIDRLNAVRAWLGRQDDIDGKRIALYGYSKGAEFALLAATKLGWPGAVVAVAPSDVVWQGWNAAAPGAEQRSSFSFAGVPLPFVPYGDFTAEMAGFRTGADVRYRRPFEQGRAAHPEAASAARIRVEDIQAPVLVAGADDDQMWDSGTMTRAIAVRRRAAGLETVALTFPDGGHMLNGTGLEPTGGYNAGPFKVGGTPEGSAHSQAEVWHAALAFLHRALWAKSADD